MPRDPLLQESDVFRPLAVMEAIHSTAMEHTHGPGGCDVCAAAAGDREALMRVFMSLERS